MRVYSYRYRPEREARENVAHSFEVDDQRRDLAPTASEIVARARSSKASSNGHGGIHRMPESWDRMDSDG